MVSSCALKSITKFVVMKERSFFHRLLVGKTFYSTASSILWPRTAWDNICNTRWREGLQDTAGPLLWLGDEWFEDWSTWSHFTKPWQGLMIKSIARHQRKYLSHQPVGNISISQTQCLLALCFLRCKRLIPGLPVCIFIPSQYHFGFIKTQLIL